MEIVNYIPAGKENAIHLTALSAQLNCSDSAVKALIQEARKQGAQIVSGRAGYWIAESDTEKQQFVNSMRSQAFTRLKSTKYIKAALNNISGQIGLFDEAGTQTE